MTQKYQYVNYKKCWNILKSEINENNPNIIFKMYQIENRVKAESIENKNDTTRQLLKIGDIRRIKGKGNTILEIMKVPKYHGCITAKVMECSGKTKYKKGEVIRIKRQNVSKEIIKTLG